MMGGHAVFSLDGEAVDAPAGTLMFGRAPSLIRSAGATVDGTSIRAVGAWLRVPYEISRRERDLSRDRDD